MSTTKPIVPEPVVGTLNFATLAVADGADADFDPSSPMAMNVLAPAIAASLGVDLGDEKITSVAQASAGGA